MTEQTIDAVPKKRGPKTDVLEALLRRVDGLERRLKDEKNSDSPNEEVEVVTAEESANDKPRPKRRHLNTKDIPIEPPVDLHIPPRWA